MACSWAGWAGAGDEKGRIVEMLPEEDSPGLAGRLAASVPADRRAGSGLYVDAVKRHRMGSHCAA